MADKIVFKPYKRKLNTWINMDEREDEETGRVIFHVASVKNRSKKKKAKRKRKNWPKTFIWTSCRISS